VAIELYSMGREYFEDVVNRGAARALKADQTLWSPPPTCRRNAS
jgi:hypothetical protein